MRKIRILRLDLHRRHQSKLSGDVYAHGSGILSAESIRRFGSPERYALLDASCTEEGNLYVVYGHRMKNRTMFGTLPYYEKRDYWAEHPYIYFDTLYEQGTYEIVAAFYSKIYEEGEAGFRYYQYKSLTDEQTFADFKKGVEKSALYKTDEELMFGDKVLLLSTCSYHTNEGRFVVVAKN